MIKSEYLLLLASLIFTSCLAPAADRFANRERVLRYFNVALDQRAEKAGALTSDERMEFIAIARDGATNPETESTWKNLLIFLNDEETIDQCAQEYISAGEYGDIFLNSQNPRIIPKVLPMLNL